MFSVTVSCSTNGTRPTEDRTGNYSVVQQKIHSSSRTNYTAANFYFALILLMS